MKKLPVFMIVRPNTAGQPLPVELRRASRAPRLRSACSPMTIPDPTATAIRICSQ